MKTFNILLRSAFYPVLFVLILSGVKLLEVYKQQNFVYYGLFPRNVDGLKGIVLGVFIHSDWKHLFNNSIPLIILGSALFHFYREAAFKVIIWVVLMGGLWTWISAREAHHIGASGLLYGLFSFLLFSGFIRKNKQLIALSLLVAFIYGSLVWGLLPIDYRMSWESHFWGFLAGFILAIYYRKIGKQREKHPWNEAEEEILEHMDFWKKKEDRNPEVNFIYKKKEEDNSNQT